LICGKPFTKDSDGAEVPEVPRNSPEKIAPPESTFKRSFPLLSQIHMLEESKMNSDYMVRLAEFRKFRTI